MNKVKHGVVIRFGARGFGFLMELGARRSYFVHINDVIGRHTLQAGDQVEFQVGPDMPGQKTNAIQVRLIESPDRLDRRPQSEQALYTTSLPLNRAVSQQPTGAQPTATERGRE